MNRIIRHRIFRFLKQGEKDGGKRFRFLKQGEKDGGKRKEGGKRFNQKFTPPYEAFLLSFV